MRAPGFAAALAPLALATLAALALAPGLAAAQPGSEPRPMVVLISVDGLRPDHVTAADAHGLRIPNLRRFVREGSYATGVRGVIPTVTYPSHTTLLTGVAPARHGIVANTTFDPLQKNEGGWYWYAEDVRTATLWEAARAAGLTTASVHWPVSVGATIDLNLPQIWRTGTLDDRKLVRALSTPGLLDRLERDVGPYADGIDETIEADETRARFVVRLLETERPSFTTAYFTALDHVQHETGPFTRAAHATLERIDALIGRVVDAAGRASGGRAVVAVVSDHGFVPTDTSLHLGVAFRRAGLLDVGRDGKPSGWRAIPWSAGGSAAIVLSDSLSAAARARIRARVRALLDSLARHSSHGIAAVLDADEAKERGAFPGAAFVIGMRPGFVLGSSLDGELVRAIRRGGAHGYLPDVEAMRASFFIAGSGIARRPLGEIDMRDVAPTLAAILGVALPAAEGRVLEVSSPAAAAGR